MGGEYSKIVVLLLGVTRYFGNAPHLGITLQKIRKW
jgi:hypothetical protein